MDQSELEANKSNRRQVWENAYDQVTILFGFRCHWLRIESGASSQNQTRRVVRQNQSKREITFDIQLN